MSSTAFVNELEDTITGDQQESRLRWEQLVDDTFNGIPRDRAEALEILSASGKSPADLSRAVEFKKKCQTKLAEFRDARAKAATYRPVSLKLQAKERELAEVTAALQAEIGQLNHELGVARSARAKCDALLNELKDTGRAISSDQMQACQSNLSQLRQALGVKRGLISDDERWLDHYQRQQSQLERSLATQENETLAAEKQFADTKVKELTASIESGRTNEAALLAQIDAGEAELKAIREQLFDPSFEG